MRGAVIDRAMARLDRQPGGCWLWTGSTTKDGYGQIEETRDGKRRSLRVHRVVYEALIGPVPDGLDLDHRCRVRRCANPAHLEPVTRGENLRRGARGFALTGRCRSGRHVPTPQSIAKRECLDCTRERNAARHKRGSTLI